MNSPLKIQSCSACRGDHENVEMRKLAEVETINGKEFTHYFLCGTTLVYARADNSYVNNWQIST